jgi:hypothetical protein
LVTSSQPFSSVGFDHRNPGSQLIGGVDQGANWWKFTYQTSAHAGSYTGVFRGLFNGQWCQQNIPYQVIIGMPSPTPSLVPTLTPAPIPPPPAGVGGWFQTGEGDVHGNGDLIRAALPANQYFSLGSNLSAGVVSLNANLATFDLPVGQISLPGWHANGLDFKGASYSFYYRLFDSPTLADFAGFKPGDSQVHYSAGDVTFQGNWQISGGQKVLLLVDGNVEIPVEITVSAADQSFFFLAASGNISFTPPVKTAQGIFLADQTLSTGSGSELFEGQGVFYGRAVDLARPGSSSTQPAEKFLYRPDFWFSAPGELLLQAHTWQELVP